MPQAKKPSKINCYKIFSEYYCKYHAENFIGTDILGPT